MKTEKDKTQERDKASVVNDHSHKQGDSKSTFQFEDKRKKTGVHNAIQDTENSAFVEQRSMPTTQILQFGRRRKDKKDDSTTGGDQSSGKNRDKSKSKGQKNSGKSDQDDKPKGRDQKKGKPQGSSDREEMGAQQSTWSADTWDVNTMIKAAKRLQKYKPQPRGMVKINSSLRILEENSSDISMQERMRTALNALAARGVECPIEESAQESQSELARAEKEIASEVLSSLADIDHARTKKYTLKPESFEVDKSGSALTRLKAKNNELDPWTVPFINSIKSDNNAFMVLVEQGPLFYGTTEGQRIHVLAARFLKDKNIDDVDPIELMMEVTKELASGAKETWPEVSNYWLEGSITSGVGLVGERVTGVEARSKSYALQDLYREEIELLQEIIDLKSGGADNAMEVRAEFIRHFHAEQAALGKDWFIDVDRPDYQHKPGRDDSQNSQQNKILMYEDLICRRMCKWMLHVAHFNNQPVIYSLDEIDLSSVSGAKTLEIIDTVSKSGKRKLKVPVCTSELREIFRAQDKFESDEPDRGVKFFKELLPVSAPWAKDRPAEEVMPWAEYALHLTKKLLSRYPGDERAMDCARKMVIAFGEQDWSAIIALYKALKPSELRDQGATVTKKDKVKTDERKRLEKAKHAKGSELVEVFHVVKSLEECIFAMNDTTDLEVPSSAKGKSSAETSGTGEHAQPETRIERVFKDRVSDVSETGIRNVGQTCYMASGLNMLAFNYAHYFRDENAPEIESEDAQDLRRKVNGVLTKIIRGELVERAEILGITGKMENMKATLEQAQARRPKERVKEKTGSKQGLKAELIESLAIDNQSSVERDGSAITQEASASIKGKEPIETAENESELRKRITEQSVQFAYRQQDVSEVIFGTLFSLLGLNLSHDEFILRSHKQMLPEAESLPIDLPPRSTPKDYETLPASKHQAQFRFELPITEAATFADAIEKYKAPETVIPEYKYLVDQGLDTEHLEQTTVTETNEFLSEQLPDTFTVTLKRFELNLEDLDNPRKINTAVDMPHQFVYGGFIYQLNTVVFHHGDFKGGHYTMSNREDDESWTHRDDSYVGTHDSFQDEKNLGYIYTYKKNGPAPEVHDLKVL